MNSYFFVPAVPDRTLAVEGADDQGMELSLPSAPGVFFRGLAVVGAGDAGLELSLPSAPGVFFRGIPPRRRIGQFAIRLPSLYQHRQNCVSAGHVIQHHLETTAYNSRSGRMERGSREDGAFKNVALPNGARVAKVARLLQPIRVTEYPQHSST